MVEDQQRLLTASTVALKKIIQRLRTDTRSQTADRYDLHTKLCFLLWNQRSVIQHRTGDTMCLKADYGASEILSFVLKEHKHKLKLLST
jgi:hypothetical protein